MLKSLSCIYAMKYPKAALTILFCTAFLIGCGQNPEATDLEPDNTRVNARDMDSAEPTADQQQQNATDLELTQRIRQSVMADESFSTYAKNIKIISQNGRVTLKGPVASDDEKTSIVAMAVAATGDATKVTDQISVEK